MAVFPESMNKLDLTNPEECLRTIENYIRYMSERVEFSNRNMSRTVNDAGMTTVEVVEILEELSNLLSVLQSTVNGMQASLNATNNNVNTLSSNVDTLGQTATAAQSAAQAATQAAANAQSTANAASQAVSALDKDVTALEGLHKVGSYVGDGAETTRTIAVGTGTALLVYDDTGIMAIVTAAGMHYMSSTTAPTYKDATVAAFANGVLTLNTTSYINVSERTYHYQVL